MNKIITRDWIKDGSIFYTWNNTEYTKEELCQIIDYCKEKLIASGAKPGQKVGMNLSCLDIFYTALLFAIFELGLKLVTLQRFHTVSETKSDKAKCHMPLDIYVCYNKKDHSFICLTTDYYINNSNKIIEVDLEWKIGDVGNAKPTPIWAKPQDEILLCNSSGTTSTPKLIYHTHEFLYDLCSYNAGPLEAEEDDVVIHSSTINHGASLSVFYLTWLHKCKKNILRMNRKNSEDMLHFLREDTKATKILLANAIFTEKFIDDIEKDDIGLPNTTFIVISFMNPKWLKVVKEGKLKKIISAFGCSETGGPLFVPCMEKNTENYDPKFMGKPTVGFYDTKQIDGLLTVDLPNGKRVITEDIVEERENGFYFISKNKLRKISDIDINPLTIVEKVEKYCSRSRFEVVVDEIHNELYIVTDYKDLIDHKNEIELIINELYPEEVKLTDIVYMSHFSYFTVAVKPDREKLLMYLDDRRRQKPVL